MSSCIIGIGAVDAAAAYQTSVYAGLSALCLLGLVACSRERAPAIALGARHRR
jgi:hypothetical protein